MYTKKLNKMADIYFNVFLILNFVERNATKNIFKKLLKYFAIVL